MFIEISTSGGFGGLEAAGIHKSVDVKTLEEPARSEIRKAFDPKELKAIAGKISHAGAADGMTYKIVIVDDDNKRHEFSVAEGVFPAEMLDMIDGF